MTDRSAPDESFDDLVRDMPDAVRSALPLVRWHLDRLWGLDLRVHHVRVDELAWLMDLPLWQLNGRRFQVSPNEVARHPARYRAQFDRAMRSDLSRPVHLVEHNARWVVLDGYHRLLKAALLGEPMSMAKFRSPLLAK